MGTEKLIKYEGIERCIRTAQSLKSYFKTYYKPELAEKYCAEMDKAIRLSEEIMEQCEDGI